MGTHADSAALHRDSLVVSGQGAKDDEGAWHGHADGFWRFVWNEAARRWECSGCQKVWA